MRMGSLLLRKQGDCLSMLGSTLVCLRVRGFSAPAQAYHTPADRQFPVLRSRCFTIGVLPLPMHAEVLKNSPSMQVVAAQQLGAAQQQLLLNPGLMPADWQAAAAAAPGYQNGFDARAANPADLTGYTGSMPRVGSAADLSNISLVASSSCLLWFLRCATGLLHGPHVMVEVTQVFLLQLVFKWCRGWSDGQLSWQCRLS